MIGLTVGDRVRECRRSRKWSQAELAKRASVSQVTISHVENNMSDQSKFLPQLASALGVSSEYLLSGKEYIEKNKGSLEDFVVIVVTHQGRYQARRSIALSPSLVSLAHVVVALSLIMLILKAVWFFLRAGLQHKGLMRNPLL